jgi:hypothetical protein
MRHDHYKNKALALVAILVMAAVLSIPANIGLYSITGTDDTISLAIVSS